MVLFPEDEHEVSRTAADKKKGINFHYNIPPFIKPAPPFRFDGAGLILLDRQCKACSLSIVCFNCDNCRTLFQSSDIAVVIDLGAGIVAAPGKLSAVTLYSRLNNDLLTC